MDIYNNLPKDLQYMVLDYIKPVDEYSKVIREFIGDIKHVEYYTKRYGKYNNTNYHIHFCGKRIKDFSNLSFIKKYFLMCFSNKPPLREIKYT